MGWARRQYTPRDASVGPTWARPGPRPARRTYIEAYRMRVSRRELTQEMRQRGPHPLSSREAGSKQAPRGSDPNMQPGFFTIWYFWKTNFTNRFLKTYPENGSTRAPSSCHRGRSALRWQGEHANVAGTPGRGEKCTTFFKLFFIFFFRLSSTQELTVEKLNSNGPNMWLVQFSNAIPKIPPPLCSSLFWFCL